MSKGDSLDVGTRQFQARNKSITDFNEKVVLQTKWRKERGIVLQESLFLFVCLLGVG